MRSGISAQLVKLKLAKQPKSKKKTATMTIELPWVPAQDMKSKDRIRRIDMVATKERYPF